MAQNKTHVLMAVCTYFDPDNRVFRAAETLQKFGYTVDLLAYHRDPLAEEEILGSGFKLKRIKSQLKLPLPRKVKNLFFYWNFKRLAKKEARILKPAFVHCHDYNTLFLGIYCKKKFASKIIYDNHEYFQDLNYIHRYPLFIRKRIAQFERRALKKWCDELIVVSDGIANLYQKFFPGKIYVVRNIPNFDFSRSEEALPEKVSGFLERQRYLDHKILLYLGSNTQRGRGLDFVFNLLPVLPENYSLLIIGSKSDTEIKHLYAKYSALHTDHDFAAFHALTHKQLNQVASFCHLGLSLIEPIYLSYKHCLPNKLFEYLEMNLAVLSSDIPDQKNLIETYNIGTIIPFEIHRAAKIIEDYTPDQKAMTQAKLDLNWAKESQIYLSVYQTHSLTLDHKWQK